MKLHLLLLSSDLQLALPSQNFQGIVEALLQFKTGSELSPLQLRASQAMAQQLLKFDEEDLSASARATQVQFVELLHDCQQKKKAESYFGVEQQLAGWMQRWREARKQS